VYRIFSEGTLHYRSGQNHHELVRSAQDFPLAARFFKLFFDHAALVGPPRIDQDKSVAGSDKVAIDRDIKNKRCGEGVNLQKSFEPPVFKAVITSAQLEKLCFLSP
jgi:hypothetical protein